MYLKRLWLHNKILCGLLVLFSAFQILNNIRQDVAFSPAYTYGMYSQVFHRQKKYIVPEIIVNGRVLQTKNFTPQQWDKIIQPVAIFQKQSEWNRAEFNMHIRRLLHLEDSSHYTNGLSEAGFNDWYKQYLAAILHANISSLSLQFQEYDLSSRRPVKLRTAERITIQ